MKKRILKSTFNDFDNTNAYFIVEAYIHMYKDGVLAAAI